MAHSDVLFSLRIFKILSRGASFTPSRPHRSGILFIAGFGMVARDPSRLVGSTYVRLPLVGTTEQPTIPSQVAGPQIMRQQSFCRKRVLRFCFPSNFIVFSIRPPTRPPSTRRGGKSLYQVRIATTFFDFALALLPLGGSDRLLCVFIHGLLHSLAPVHSFAKIMLSANIHSGTTARRRLNATGTVLGIWADKRTLLPCLTHNLLITIRTL